MSPQQLLNEQLGDTGPLGSANVQKLISLSTWRAPGLSLKLVILAGRERGSDWPDPGHVPKGDPSIRGNHLGFCQ